jgi:hypothetical protein
MIPCTQTPSMRSCVISASDGLGSLTAPARHLNPAARAFCVDASTYWRSTRPNATQS